MIRHKSVNNTPVTVAMLAISALIFVIDFLTPIGMTEWVLYLIPVAICVRQNRPVLPFYAAGLSTVLIILGYIVSPPGIVSMRTAVINRSFGVFVMLTVAALAYQAIRERLRARRLNWLREGQSANAMSMMGELDINSVGSQFLRSAASFVDAQMGLLYRLEQGRLVRSATYAYVAPAPDADAAVASPGHGLADEVARSGKPVLLRQLPADYARFGSLSGSALPAVVAIVPILLEGKVIGVGEFGFARDRHDFADELELLAMVGEGLALAWRSAQYRQHLRELLEETQRQSEALQTQQEELRVSNEELEEQGRALRESQARLENQQAELEQTNVQLEEQAQRLELQKRDLLQAHQHLAERSGELERASQYKSEFLANMSHELRTPLNSSLILSQILTENRSGGLSEDDIRYARTIYASNSDLLTLINDILDLSKIEAGHANIEPAPVSLGAVSEALRLGFEALAAEKGLTFRIEVDALAAPEIITDNLRLQQILKNLLSNAFKFTERGQVVLSVRPGRIGRMLFAVSDTGIGIGAEQQQVIFDAFRQADGSTSRKYGGTGLGLSISRELARLLGGEIRVESAAGAGSTFTLEIADDLVVGAAASPAGPAGPAAARAAAPYANPAATGMPDMFSAAATAGSQALPGTLAPGTGAAAGWSYAATPPLSGANAVALPATAADRAGAMPHPAAGAANAAPADAMTTAGAAPASVHGADDRQARRHPRLILVIEDDQRFAAVLYQLAHELEFDCIMTSFGAEALRLAREHRPSGILLDVGLPDQSGLSVLERLKRDPLTRHIPVHMISADDHVQTAMALGAVGYAVKPVARDELVVAIGRLEQQLQTRARRVLVVEDDAALRENIKLLLDADDIEISTAGSIAEALALLTSNTYDCMVMDLTLPDGSGYELLEQLAGGGAYAFPPVIVYTGRALSRAEEQTLQKYAKSIIIKGAKSPERLLDEVSLFLHRVVESLPQDQQRLLSQARQRDAVFEGRKILLAEDDVRNIFALSSIFEPLGVQLLIARNGREALEQLDRHAEIDLVLMDLMMPEMDGLTAMRLLRQRPQWARLPVIALTAKAMADDRRNCLDAGANDYIAKPIDVDKLVSLCRVWMPK